MTPKFEAMPALPPSLDRRPAKPNAALEGGDVPEDDYIMGVIPTDRAAVDIVTPEDVAAAVTDAFGTKYRHFAARINALFAARRWHVIREG